MQINYTGDGENGGATVARHVNHMSCAPCVAWMMIYINATELKQKAVSVLSFKKWVLRSPWLVSSSTQKRIVNGKSSVFSRTAKLCKLDMELSENISILPPGVKPDAIAQKMWVAHGWPIAGRGRQALTEAIETG
jgi:hypothetical protein